MRWGPGREKVPMASSGQLWASSLPDSPALPFPQALSLCITLAQVCLASDKGKVVPAVCSG